MASETYIVITDDETKPDHHVEVPVEANNLLLVSTLDAQFPGASGLKYRTDTGAFRGLRVTDGYVHPPSDTGWGQNPYVVIVKGMLVEYILRIFIIGCHLKFYAPFLLPLVPAQAKRKAEDEDGAPPAKSLYTQQLSAAEPNPATSDLIVLGLPWRGTTADLQQYFSQYGQLAVCQVIHC